MPSRPILKITALAVLLLPVAAQAVTHGHAKTAAKPAAPAGPALMGKFGDWQSATLDQSGETMCYAFTRPQKSAPAVAGRGDVFFTVTERAKLRDTVSLTAGFAYASGAKVSVTVDGKPFPFYTSGRSAFAHDGAALIKAFTQGTSAVVTSPGPKGKVVRDEFSLKGFQSAFNAVQEVCPAQ
jgi:invasion protein IalB